GTGIHVTDGGSLSSVTENFITGNTGDGILITATAGSVAPVFNNDLSGNGGAAVNNQSATTVDAAGNWWGVATAAGGAAQARPHGDYSRGLAAGPDPSADTGFQGDFAALVVGVASPRNAAQVTAGTQNLQEGINLVTVGGTVTATAGTYVENLTINKN